MQTILFVNKTHGLCMTKKSVRECHCVCHSCVYAADIVRCWAKHLFHSDRLHASNWLKINCFAMVLLPFEKRTKTKCESSTSLIYLCFLLPFERFVIYTGTFANMNLLEFIRHWAVTFNGQTWGHTRHCSGSHSPFLPATRTPIASPHHRCCCYKSIEMLYSI